MNVATVTMPKDEAKKAWQTYRDLVRTRARTEDQAMSAAYRTLAKGHAIVDLSEAIRAAGCNERGYPKLAIASATAAWCRVERFRTTARFEWSKKQEWWRTKAANRLSLPDNLWPLLTPIPPSAESMVPTIPPHLRPARGLDLYHVLWEAEWSPVPPRDPMLLRRISGMLFAVLATWNLSPVERLILGAVRGGRA